jgi:transketolase
MTKTKEQELKQLCAAMRRELLRVLHKIQTGHPGGSLSCCEILSVLYFNTMKIDPANPELPGRDRLILSKGHAAPMLYLCLAHSGYFPLEEMEKLRQAGSMLQGHPCASKTPGVELSTGPLGLGLSAGLGMAEAARLNGESYNVFVILGDGEIQEGAVWEAAMSAAKFRTGNLIAILDHNGVQLDGTNDEIMPVGDIGAKFASFGWHVVHTDGHDVAALADALDKARIYRDRPVIVIAETVKGKGVSFMEGKSEWHGKPVSDGDFAAAMQELGADMND